jgi:putative flippase GtrA
MARQIVDSEPNALGQPGTAVSAPVEKKIPSYQPTRWPVVNRSLDFVDAVTHGRADWAQRLVSYLFVGGFAALVNLAVFSIIYYWVFPIPPNTTDEFIRGLHWFVAFAIATEISILANFIPNDYLTFRHLPGHKRTWLERCVRFHMTCVAGTLLTLGISFALHLVHVQAWIAQAIALILVTAFNFTAHHVFTYRHKKPATV